MDSELIFGSDKQKVPSIINDPFRGECIDHIFIRMYKNIWSRTKRYEFKATIGFKNGDTSGEQEIIGEDLTDLYQKVYEFCESFKENE